MYDIFYGLKAKPFRYVPGTKCFFLSQSHKKALQHLRSGIQRREGIVVLTGVEGCGKSSLFDLLAKELDHQQVVLGKILNARQADESILTSLLTSFQQTVSHDDKTLLIKQLMRFLVGASCQGKRCVIMVDAAQDLSDRSLEILRLLAELRYHDNSVVQLVLVGDEMLENRLIQESHAQFRQKIIGQHRMDTMPAQDAKQYILHRLKCVGWRGSPQIQEPVFQRIFQLTEGNPSRINDLYDRLLMLSMLHEKQVIDTYDIEMLLLRKNQQNHSNKTYTHYTKNPSTMDDVIVEAMATPDNTESIDVLQQYSLQGDTLQNSMQVFNVSAWKKRQITQTFLGTYIISLLLALLIYYFF